MGPLFRPVSCSVRCGALLPQDSTTAAQTYRCTIASMHIHTVRHEKVPRPTSWLTPPPPLPSSRSPLAPPPPYLLFSLSSPLSPLLSPLWPLPSPLSPLHPPPPSAGHCIYSFAIYRAQHNHEAMARHEHFQHHNRRPIDAQSTPNRRPIDAQSQSTHNFFW